MIELVPLITGGLAFALAIEVARVRRLMIEARDALALIDRKMLALNASPVCDANRCDCERADELARWNRVDR